MNFFLDVANVLNHHSLLHNWLKHLGLNHLGLNHLRLACLGHKPYNIDFFSKRLNTTV
jgi:hypothetical protein